MPRTALWMVLLLTGAMVVPIPARAQGTTGTIRGTVTDTTGASIPGAGVTAKNKQTGLARNTTTNSAGLFVFSTMPVGTYEVQVEFTAFKTAVFTDIGLSVSEVRVVNAQLEPGDITESISVESPLFAVQTAGGEVAGLVTGQEARELPLNGRNFLQLTLLQPGVAANEAVNTKDKGLLGGSDISVSGNPTTANMWTVDGANNNDIGSNRTILIYPSVDAIEEFKIQRNAYGAEFGGASGAQINIVTRSGTNDFHGSGFYFGRNDALNSTNYFLKKANKDKEELSRHDFGWTLGGPIIKDKLHFFASQEWNRETRGVVRTAFVPTAEERAGNFSGPGISGCTSAAPNDPLTGQPFPGNRIPANRLSAAGLAYLQLYPLPNTVPAAGSCTNWVASLATPLNWRQENIRLDWTITPTVRLMLRYTQDSWKNETKSAPALWGDDAFPAVDSNWDQPGKSFVAQLTNTIGNNATNNLTFTYSGNKIFIDPSGETPELDQQIVGLMPSVFPISEKGAAPGSTGVSHPVFWGGSGYDSLWNQGDFYNNQDLFVLKDDYSAVFGAHTIRAGALFSWNTKNEDTLGNASDRNWRFWGPGAGVNGWGANSGNLLADFLLQDMTWGFSEASTNYQNPQRWRDREIYLSDTWKAAPRVTLDLGLRYTQFRNPYADDNRMSSFQPDLYDPALGNDQCNGMLLPPGTDFCQQVGAVGGAYGPNRSLSEESNTLFAPRLGIAWDVFGNGKTAVRAGLGKFFLRERVSEYLNLANNPPFVKSASGLRKLDSNVEPCDGCFQVAGAVPNAGKDQVAQAQNAWQWNLTVQHELLRNTTLQVSYVGNRGIHQLRNRDLNYISNGDLNHNGVDDRLDFVRDSAGGGAVGSQVRPFGALKNGTITYWDHGGDFIYHGLQSQVRSRFGRGSMFQASYTWSRTIANMDLDNADGGLSADMAPLDFDNPSVERGLAQTHRMHLFNTSLVLLLPTLEEKSGFTKHVLGDWEIGVIAFAGSGAPLYINTGGMPGLNGGPSGTGYTDNQVPNRVPGQSCSPPDGSAPEQILNPNKFTLNGFELGKTGDAGRGTCQGPGLFSVDLALFKNIRVSERVRLQLRFEVFNLLNRNNFLGAGAGISEDMNPTSITLDTGNAATATRIIDSTIPSNFGQATATRDPRQAQFGIKLTF